MDYTSFGPGGFRNTPPLPELPPPHGIFSPKLIGVILIIIALGGGAVYAIWWWGNQNSQVAVPTFTPRPSASVTPDPITANWPTFNSKLLNFSFKYPSVASYQEEDVFEGRGTIHTGKEIYFTDKNSQSPGFDILTNDFTADDSVVHDFIQGTLSTGNFTLIGGWDAMHQKKRQVGPGMYEVVAYGSLECSPTVGAYLIVFPPKGTNLKYESFNLYNTPSISGFAPSDFDPSDPCSPKESAINLKIDYLFNQKDSVLERSLGTAIEIASTFQTSNSADTSTWKTYTNTQYGFSFKYPGNWFVNTGGPLQVFLLSPELNTFIKDGGQKGDSRVTDIFIRLGNIESPSTYQGYIHHQETIAGNAFTYYEGPGLAGTYYYFEIPQNGTVIDFGTDDGAQGGVTLLRQILSTFKFTK